MTIPFGSAESTTCDERREVRLHERVLRSLGLQPEHVGDRAVLGSRRPGEALGRHPGHDPQHVVVPDRGGERAAEHRVPEVERERVRRAGEPDPHGGRYLPREPDEPRVRVVLRRPGLAGDRPCAERRRGTGPARDDALHHRRHQMRDLGRDDLLARRLVPVEHPVGVEHLGHGEGLAVLPVVRDGLVRRGHLDRCDVRGPERERRHGRQLRLDPHVVRGLDDLLGAHVQDQLREHHVDRVLRGAPQARRTRRHPAPSAFDTHEQSFPLHSGR